MVKNTTIKEWYRKIGRMGGKATKQKLGADHFAKIGKKGGKQTGRLIHAGQEALDREEAIASVEHETRQAERNESEREWDE